jgi:hypothetical protein
MRARVRRAATVLAPWMAMAMVLVLGSGKRW